MEQGHREQQIRDSQISTWERLMYVSLGSAVTILFHGVDPLRDAIILFTLLYTTLAGFYLLWTSSAQSHSLVGWRKQVAFGHLFASWLVVLGIFSYSMLPPLGLVVLGYAVFLLAIYWRTRKKTSARDEMFP
jgi:hypothetical protein